MADLTVSLIPTADLIAYAQNARLHTDAQVRQIAASIGEFGFNNPVLVDATNTLIAGHGRVLAAKRLGLEHVPTIRLGHLTPQQARAFRLADNQIALNAGWDESMLAEELRALNAADFDMNLMGFPDSDLTRLLALDQDAGDTNEDEDAPDPPANPVTLPGDVWCMGKHRIACGSSTDPAHVAALLAGTKPMLMVTDPPYGVNYDPVWRKRVGIDDSKRMGVVLNDDTADWRDAWALFPGDVAYVWHGGLHAGVVQESLVVSGFDTRAQIIWAKESLVMHRGAYHWQHEPCWYAVRQGGKGHWTGDRKQTTLWQIATRGDAQEDDATIHSTQKPVECMRRPMVNHTSRGDLVYEPFSGSGTTIIAAESIGRVCLASELNPAYVDVAVLRWQAFAKGVARLGTPDGPTFAHVAAERGVAPTTP